MLTPETRTPFTPGVQRLAAPALRTLADVLSALYAEPDVNQLPRIFADALAQLVPGEAHGVVMQDRASGRRHWHLRPATSGHEALAPVFLANVDQHAPTRHRRLTGTGAALALSDFSSRAELDGLKLHAGFYRPVGLEDDLSISVSRGDAAICAAVFRSRRGFRPEEHERMNALRPHFKQAWANAETVAELTRAANAAEPREWTPAPLQSRFNLTPREAEVLLWVAQGKTNAETAQILGIQRDTVRTHLERVFFKLGVETRHAAGLRAMEVLGLPALGAVA